MIPSHEKYGCGKSEANCVMGGGSSKRAERETARIASDSDVRFVFSAVTRKVMVETLLPDRSLLSDVGESDHPLDVG